MKTSEEVIAWLHSLEAERHDRSYLQPKLKYTQEQPKIVYREKRVNHKFRDNVMFQEGRYSMGARDQAALTGHQLASNLLKEAK